MLNPFILPVNISSLNEIQKYEYLHGNNPTKVNTISYYKFVEKQSLLQYYNEFKDKIYTGDIFKYLELSPLLFKDEYKQKYNAMLLKFAEEIQNYINIQK